MASRQLVTWGKYAMLRNNYFTRGPNQPLRSYVMLLGSVIKADLDKHGPCQSKETDVGHVAIPIAQKRNTGSS